MQIETKVEIGLQVLIKGELKGSSKYNKEALFEVFFLNGVAADPLGTGHALVLFTDPPLQHLLPSPSSPLPPWGVHRSLTRFRVSVAAALDHSVLLGPYQLCPHSQGTLVI